MSRLSRGTQGFGDGRLRDMSFRMFSKVMGVVFLGLGLSAAAHAQVGVYGMYSVTHYSGIQCLSDAPVNCSNGVAGRTLTGVVNGVPTYGSPNTGIIDPSGGLGGVYWDFKSFGPVRLGVDVRAGANHDNKSGTSATGGDGSAGGQYFLGGLRGSVHTPFPWLKPYAQISAGYAHSNITEPTNATTTGAITAPRYYDKFVQYEGFVGADIRIASFIDFRAVELGIGNMNRIGSGSPLDGSSSVGIRSLASGVVFHLP